jgi:hypothetical protein
MAGAPEMRSGKHRASGLKVILACTINGHLMWISDPVNGSRHDMHCLRESGLLEDTDPSFFSGDTGFLGADMITPIRKPRPDRMGNSSIEALPASDSPALNYRKSLKWGS